MVVVFVFCVALFALSFCKKFTIFQKTLSFFFHKKCKNIRNQLFLYGGEKNNHHLCFEDDDDASDDEDDDEEHRYRRDDVVFFFYRANFNAAAIAEQSQH